MPTQQFDIDATNAAATIIGANSNRRYLLIQNYFGSAQTMWVLFVPASNPSQVATCGTGGELEIPPGYAREFGVSRLTSPDGLIANNQTFQQPNCPLEAISIIAGTLGTPTGTADGAIMVISP